MSGVGLIVRTVAHRRAADYVRGRLLDNHGELLKHTFSDPVVGLVTFRVKRPMRKKQKESGDGPSGDVAADDADGSALGQFAINDLEMLVNRHVDVAGSAEQLEPVGRPASASGLAANGNVLHAYALRSATSPPGKSTVCIFSAADQHSNATAAKFLHAARTRSSRRRHSCSRGATARARRQSVEIRPRNFGAHFAPHYMS